uniref:WW domain-containing protein n=1 Tax=Hyaloperonospora arabidopsidis (strain Emoy2) TaxID=559515 RepID=M4C103_HYAAE
MRAVGTRAAARAIGCSQRHGVVSKVSILDSSFSSSMSRQQGWMQALVPTARSFASTPSRSPVGDEPKHKFAWAVTAMAPPSPGRGFIGRSTNVDVTTSENPIKRWHWLWKMLGFLNEDDRLFRHSTAVFQSCMNCTARPEYYKALGMPCSFRSQQALLMVHVWLVHRRLAVEGEQGKVMQELMFDRLWEETVVRIRYYGISELAVNKHLAEVQQVCFNACIAYDKGLKNGPNVLQSAVAQHLLENETAEGLRIASIMATYMKQELKNLEKVDAKYIMEGTVPWSSLPATHATAIDKPDPDDDDVVLIGQRFGNWRSALDNRGKLYYWNLTTRYSVWDRPTGDKLHEGSDEHKSS